MKTILELTDELNHKVRSAQDITDRADKENRQISPAETKQIKDLLAEADTIRAEVKVIEEAESLRKQVTAAVGGLTAPNNRVVQPQAGNIEPKGDDTRITFPNRRVGKLKAFTGQDAEFNAYKSGQFILASMFGNYRATRWCEQNGMDIRNSLGEGTNTAGGFLVPDEMAATLIDLRETYGIFRQNAQVIPMGRETMTIPRKSSRGTASFTAEAGTVTASDPAFNSVQLTAQKLARVVRVSTELDEDAIMSIGDIVTDDIAYSFALKEDQCGFIGDASLTYGGMTGLVTKLNDSAYAGGKYAAASGHDTMAEIDTTDLSGLMAKLPQYALMNAKFYCSSVALALIFQRLGLAAGGNTIQTLSGKFMPAYAGYPIVVSQVLPTSTSTINGTCILLFGDLRMASTMGERRGFTIQRDPSIYFLQDQIAIRATERIDIVNHDVGDSTNAGPIVALHGTT